MNGLEWKLIRLGSIDNQKTVGDVVCSRFALPFSEVRRGGRIRLIIGIGSQGTRSF